MVLISAIENAPRVSFGSANQWATFAMLIAVREYDCSGRLYQNFLYLGQM